MPPTTVDDITVNVITDSMRPDCAHEFPGLTYSDRPGRITTIVMRYPRWIHAEFLTHRDRARNAASSRAISVKKGLLNHQFRPMDIPSERRGMQGGDELNEMAKDAVYRDIDELCALTLEKLNNWASMGVHKSIINRYLEPFSFIEVVCTSTRWDHFLGLRDHPMAEPHFQVLAKKIRQALDLSIPRVTGWHLPYITYKDVEDIPDGEIDFYKLMRVSAARCAGISYQRPDFSVEKELAVCQTLVDNKHSSPLEHPAMCEAFPVTGRSGPMVGWKTLRSILKQD